MRVDVAVAAGLNSRCTVASTMAGSTMLTSSPSESVPNRTIGSAELAEHFLRSAVHGVSAQPAFHHYRAGRAGGTVAP